MRVPLRVALPFALVVGALAAYFAMSRAPDAVPAAHSEQGEDDRAAGEPSDAGLSPRQLREIERVGREIAGKAPSETAPAAAYHGPLHVKGRVLAPEGVALAGGRVHLGVDTGDAKGTVVAIGDVAADGTIDFGTKGDVGATSLVRLALVVPGFVSLAAEAVPDAKGDVLVEFSLTDAVATPDPTGRSVRPFSGRVLDEAGNPKVGLRVVVEATPGELPSTDAAAPDDGLAVLRGNIAQLRLRGTARTDRDGRFEIRGLRCGGCARTHSGDPAWFILDDRANRDAWNADRPLTAVPAVRSEIRVVEAGTDAPLSEFTVTAVTERGIAWSRKGVGGRLDVLWPRPEFARETWLEFSVRADGFRPETTRVTLPAAAGLHTARIHLRRLSERDAGKIVVRASGAGAAHLSRARLVVDLREPGSSVDADEFPLVSAGGSRATAAVPAGTWEARIRSLHYGYRTIHREARVTVAAGGEAEIVLEIPALGILDVRWAIRDVDWTTMVLRPKGGGEPLRSPVVRTSYVPVGSWTFSLEDEKGVARDVEDVTIVEDETTPVRKKSDPDR